MFGLEINDTVVVEQRAILEKALSTDPKMQKELQKLLRQVIMEARAAVVSTATFRNGDPRHSRRAVRTAVYKKILGANINIYNSRRAHGMQRYTPPRTLQEGQWGGNRRRPSARTIQLQSYAPEDRGFILRFVNSGTGGRNIAAGNRAHKDGNRGSIAGTGFFGALGERQMVAAADRLAVLIDTEFEKIMKK